MMTSFLQKTNQQRHNSWSQTIRISKRSNTLAQHLAQQLTPKFFMEFNFGSDDERIALEQNDIDILPHFGIINQSRFHKKGNHPRKLCQDDICLCRSWQQSGTRPLTVKDFQEFRAGLEPLSGYWSVLWSGGSRSLDDVVYDDNFRCVVIFRCIELAIRPVQEEDGSKVSRI